MISKGDQVLDYEVYVAARGDRRVRFDIRDTVDETGGIIDRGVVRQSIHINPYRAIGRAVGLDTRTVCWKRPVCGLKLIALTRLNGGLAITVTLTGAEVPEAPRLSVAPR